MNLDHEILFMYIRMQNVIFIFKKSDPKIISKRIGELQKEIIQE